MDLISISFECEIDFRKISKECNITSGFVQLITKPKINGRGGVTTCNLDSPKRLVEEMG